MPPWAKFLDTEGADKKDVGRVETLAAKISDPNVKQFAYRAQPNIFHKRPAAA